MNKSIRPESRWPPRVVRIGSIKGQALLLGALAAMQIACTAGVDRGIAGGGVESPTSSRLELGRETYLEVCAHCHDTGVGGAPVTGEPGDWTGRSPLWQSVLFEHAESGHLAMPAQAGGDGRPSADAVDAAAEYMLTQSHPHTPPD